MCPFFDRDFVDREPFEAFVGGLAEVLQEGLLVEVLDGFGIKVQVCGHGLDAKALAAQFRGISSQPDGDALMRIDEVQSLDMDTAAVLAANLAVVDLEEHREIHEIQITHELTCVRVDRSLPAAVVAKRADAPIGLQANER